MSRNVIETVMGGVVLVVAALFLFFAYTTSQIRSISGYELTAAFERVDGVREGGDVRLNGIKVGTIKSQTLDPKTYQAVVKMTIDPKIQLPKDTMAQITSSSLLGDKYLSLEPGVEDAFIQPGGRIERTLSGVNLEALLARVGGMGLGGQGQAPAPGAEGTAAPAPQGGLVPSLK